MLNARILRFFAGTCLTAVLLSGAIGSATAQVTRPLTLEGKRALYQRVIAVPGASVVPTAGASMRQAQLVAPFTVFYVYERATVQGREWLRVGVDSIGDTEGWLPAEQGVEWRQTLTVGFKDPATQPRVPLFADRNQLKTIAETNNVAEFAALRQRGARVQRPLWASTGTKNPAYHDLLYVETLMGADTVNTLPPKTYLALLDHGIQIAVCGGYNTHIGSNDFIAADPLEYTLLQYPQQFNLHHQWHVANFMKE